MGFDQQNDFILLNYISKLNRLMEYNCMCHFDLKTTETNTQFKFKFITLKTNKTLKTIENKSKFNTKWQNDQHTYSQGYYEISLGFCGELLIFAFS